MPHLPTDHEDSEGSIPMGRPAWGEVAAIVVPKLRAPGDGVQSTAAGIDPGSAIVACSLPGMPHRILVYYEGNRNGAVNLQSLRERAICAYGRMAQHYPTVAMSVVNRADFVMVGSITPDHFEVDTSSPDLAAWVAHDPRLLDTAPRLWWTDTRRIG